MFFRCLRRGGWFLGGCGGCGGSVGRSFAVILLLAVYITSVSVFWTLSGDLQASNEISFSAAVRFFFPFVGNFATQPFLGDGRSKNPLVSKTPVPARPSPVTPPPAPGPEPTPLAKDLVPGMGDKFREFKLKTPDSTPQPFFVHAYSAFLDSRHAGPDFVRIMAIANPATNQRRLADSRCVLQDGASGNLTSASMKVTILKEQKGRSKTFAGFFIDCEAVGRKFTKVALAPKSKAEEMVKSGSFQYTNVMDIVQMAKKDMKKEEEEEKELVALCLKPFHNEFNRAIWFVEFVEYYRLMGVTHFVLYNTSVGPDVTKVLKLYDSLGVTVVLKWDLPQKDLTVGTVPYKDMVVSHILTMNDCNLRVAAAGRFTYVVHVDLDEFLVPRQFADYSLVDVLRRTNSNSKTRIGSYVFRNTFYYLYFENDTTVLSDTGLGSRVFPELSVTDLGHKATYKGKTGAVAATVNATVAVRPYLLTQAKTRRLVEFHKKHERSKYIARPEGIDQVGHHYVHSHFPGFREHNLEPDQGSSNHYRICELGGFDCLKRPTEIDRIGQRWAVDLLPRIQEVCVDSFDGEPCPEAPPLGSPW